MIKLSSFTGLLDYRHIIITETKSIILRAIMCDPVRNKK